ncbi:MAG: hypothetical protein GY694_05805 [Gammaproteobacteria bacterium]|nr:hypothetical protein [Gammaproteobacteria bacterium]
MFTNFYFFFFFVFPSVETQRVQEAANALSVSTVGQSSDSFILEFASSSFSSSISFSSSQLTSTILNGPKNKHFTGYRT